MENKQPQDLEIRTLLYAGQIIRLVKELSKNPINFHLGGQILKSGTSVGANYREARGAESEREFKFRISVCKKEARESQYWLILICESNQELSKKIDLLLQETEELIKIFASICHKIDQKTKNPKT